MVYAAAHSGEIFATLVWAGGVLVVELAGGVDTGDVEDGAEVDDEPGRH